MEDNDIIERNEGGLETPSQKEVKEEEIECGEKAPLETELNEFKDKYLRLYAEFENYRKRVQREKEDLVRYSKEDIFYDILPVIDNLEMALQHSSDKLSEGIVKGVEMTLREFQRVTEKFGLIPIAAMGKPFDPAVHHAMSQVERSDMEDKTIVEEFRKGYMLGGKVLRPSLVAVSKKPVSETETEIENNEATKEE